jgi:hypothetical protein
MDGVGTPKPRVAQRFLPMNAPTRSCRSPQVGGASSKFLPWHARGRYRWTTNEVLTP